MKTVKYGVVAIQLLVGLMLSLSVGAQSEPRIVTFDVPQVGEIPGAGVSAGLGTVPQDNNDAGEITGYYEDDNFVFHGFVRKCDGSFETFNATGAGLKADSTNGTFPESINHRGDVTGYLQKSDNSFHGFVRYADGTFATFDPNGSAGTFPANINSYGWISGYYSDSNNINHGFVREPDGTIQSFDDPNASQLVNVTVPQGTVVALEEAMNDDGSVVGWYCDSKGAVYGYLRERDGNFIPIDVPGAASGGLFLGTLVGGINRHGATTGYYVNDKNVAYGYFRGRDGALTTFSVPGASDKSGAGTAAFTLNSGNEITGAYYDDKLGTHGFVRLCDGTIKKFDVEGAATSFLGTRPTTINSSGQVVGYYTTANGVYRGFLRWPDHGFGKKCECEPK
ncbi:MAG: hypothetical protein WB607_14975 [Candidatus Acidiferrum sp.]|jgi:probable HAF family extracellular repeat protein